MLQQKRLYCIAILSAAAAAALLLLLSPVEQLSNSAAIDSSQLEAPTGPPWISGREDAQFTVVLYADFACEHCRSSFPVLMQWISAHPEVRLQWHHLPTAGGGSAALQLARVAECAGESGGNIAFWATAEKIFQHTPHEDMGIDSNENCLGSLRPDAIVQAHIAAAAQEGITATPTLKLVERMSGKFIVLRGPTDGDALVSAMDFLTASSTTEHPSQPH